MPASESTNALRAYRDARARSRLTGVRDWVSNTLSQAALRLGSPAYRRMVDEAVKRGLAELADENLAARGHGRRGHR